MNNLVFVGAGGTGMSALVFLMERLGYTNIIAINNEDNEIMQSYDHNPSITCIIGHGVYDVQRDDIVIYSNIEAIKQGPELTQSRQRAAQNDKKHYHWSWTYNECVAELSKYMKTICVCGTDGKSNTTGLLIHTMMQSDPSFACGILGANLADYDQKNLVLNEAHTEALGNIVHAMLTTQQPDPRYIKQYWFVLESCEYKRNFLLYDADHLLITSIFPDHMDYYTDADDYHHAFVQRINATRHRVIMTQQAAQALVTYQGDINKKHTDLITASPVDVHFSSVFGHYHKINAGLVSTLMHDIAKNNRQERSIQTTQEQTTQEQKTMKDDDIITTIAAFGGLGRRMEKIRHTETQIVYSDYAHTPKALVNNYHALREHYPDQHLVLLFQPHQAKRILAGRDDFVHAIGLYDKAYLAPIYAAREDFAVLQAQYPTETAGLTDFDQLSASFAHDAGAGYATHQDITRLVAAQQGIVLAASAGDLDRIVRKALSS